MDGQDKHGGTAILVKKNLVVRPAWKLCHVGGSAQAFWLGGKLLVSLYLAPTFESQEVFALTVAKLFSLPQGTQWVMGGDFNATPEECPFRYVFGAEAFEILASGKPTRWNGKRCIDYFLSDQYHGTPSAPEIHISDHIIQELQLDFQESRHPSVSLAPSPRIPPYPGSDAVWQRAANRVWCQQQQLVPQSWSQDLDQDWAQLSKTFFDTLLQTQVELVPETVSSVPAALLRRGRPDKVQIKTRDRLVKPTAGWFATFKERHLSNLLARLHEAQRMQNQARTSVAQAMHEKALWERIRRSQYYDPSKGIQMNIQIISRTLEQHTAQADRARLDRWTQKMQHDKHALKWLRQERSPLYPSVKVSQCDAKWYSPGKLAEPQ